MCGFVGILGENKTVDKKLFENSLYKISHRGPDEKSIQEDSWWKLGFNRLQILDLSSNGRQPMFDDEHQVVISFNGELYNYKEIKRELTQAGIKFKGTSDTEVLLKYYIFLNKNFELLLKNCNGMYAFSIIDIHKKEAYIARDRLGVKPLYFSEKKNTLYFSSEIKSIKSLFGYSSNISNKSIVPYLRLGFIPPWSSSFDDIQSLLPGHYGIWKLQDKKLDIRRYWTPEINSQIKSKDEWLEELKSLLIDSTKIRLNSDVPVGLFLSGGIDSGLIAASISKLSATNIKAHSIRFAKWENDETALAKKTADHLGVDLSLYDHDEISFEEMVNIIRHFDQPFADPSAIVTSLVCKKAKETSKVILTGDGGDEMFAGYREYTRIIKYKHLDLLPESVLNSIGKIFVNLPNKKINRIGQRLSMDHNLRSMWTHIFPFDQTLEVLIKNDLRNENKFEIEKIYEHIIKSVSDNQLRNAQIADISCYLPNNVLIKTDMMSMMHSIELRSPFLDYRIAQLGLSMPSHLKIHGNETKKILRDLAGEWLPNDIATGRKKGFGIPLNHFLTKDNKIKDEVIDVLLSLKSTNLFNNELLEKYIFGNDTSDSNLRNIYKLFSLSVILN